MRCFDCGSLYEGDKTSTRCPTCQRTHANEMRRRRENAGPGGIFTAEFRCASCRGVFTYEKSVGTRSSRRKCDSCKRDDSRKTSAARLGPLREAFAYAERLCSRCGDSFRPSNSAHKYCSKTCATLAARERRKKGLVDSLATERDCKGCGAAFSPRSARHVYCSSACRPSRIGLEIVDSEEIGGRRVEVSRDRANQMARDFGMSTSVYLELWRRQHGSCAICEEEFPERPHPSIDHDALTMQVRGLLCFNCNVGIGYLKHSVSNLQAALRFLDSPPAAIPMTSSRTPMTDAAKPRGNRNA